MLSGMYAWAANRLVGFADLRPDDVFDEPSEWTADRGALRRVVAVAVVEETGTTSDGSPWPYFLYVNLDATGAHVSDWLFFNHEDALARLKQEHPASVTWEVVTVPAAETLRYVQARLASRDD